MDETTLTLERNQKVLSDWLDSCTRGNKISRNTVAIGIVVLDHLRNSTVTLREDAVSKGGEITGARSGLKNILAKYDLPGTYLKEVTTRQAHQDGQRLFNQSSPRSRPTNRSFRRFYDCAYLANVKLGK